MPAAQAGLNLNTLRHGLNRLRKKCLFVIPSEARNLLFFANPKKNQIPRANPALRNDLLRVFPQPREAVPYKDLNNSQAEAFAPISFFPWDAAQTAVRRTPPAGHFRPELAPLPR